MGALGIEFQLLLFFLDKKGLMLSNHHFIQRKGVKVDYQTGFKC